MRLLSESSSTNVSKSLWMAQDSPRISSAVCDFHVGLAHLAAATLLMT